MKEQIEIRKTVKYEYSKYLIYITMDTKCVFMCVCVAHVCVRVMCMCVVCVRVRVMCMCVVCVWCVHLCVLVCVCGCVALS